MNMQVIGMPSGKGLFFLCFSFLFFAGTVSAQSAEDSAAKAKKGREDAIKAKATEVYSPVPPIVTLAKRMQNHPLMLLFYLTVKTWICGGQKVRIPTRQPDGKYTTIL
jgi:hypothetical protein